MATYRVGVSSDGSPTPGALGPWRGRLTLLFVALVVVGVALAQVFRPARTDPLVGQPAPNVEASLFDGSHFSLSDQLSADGRPVILNLWASWCLPCREEMPDLSTFATAHPSILVVGIAVDDTEAHARAFVDELRPSYPVGFDDSGDLAERFQAPGLPTTVLIDANGVVRKRWTGPVTAADLSSALG